jgi:polyhydroxybutyrate depolymerase
LKKWFKRLVFIVLGLLVALIVVIASVFLLSNDTNGTLVSGGEQRSYLLYVPESYNPDVHTPLVISIHGYAEWPAHQMEISRWNRLADQYGFIVVYPSGTRFPLHWRTFGSQDGATETALDVTFISDLIDKLATEYNIDPTRVYANGLSNGGGMSFVLSCELSERIAAIGSVSGAYLYPWDECNPSRAVPTILFHGTADPIVPYEGGPSQAFDIPFPNIPDWVDTLANRNGCAEEPQTLPTGVDVRGVMYPDCAGDVIFYSIDGGGHTWPGGKPLPKIIAGVTTQQIDATQLMWDFFQQHPLADR